VLSAREGGRDAINPPSTCWRVARDDSDVVMRQPICEGHYQDMTALCVEDNCKLVALNKVP
jgi:hypothetical protein